MEAGIKMRRLMAFRLAMLSISSQRGYHFYVTPWTVLKTRQKTNPLYLYRFSLPRPVLAHLFPMQAIQLGC